MKKFVNTFRNGRFEAFAPKWRERKLSRFRRLHSEWKKGFDAAGFLADLPARATEMNEALRGLLVTPAPIRISPTEGPLADRRLWSTRLNGADIAMPCGGTHLTDLAELTKVMVSMAPTEDGFVMRTCSS